MDNLDLPEQPSCICNSPTQTHQRALLPLAADEALARGKLAQIDSSREEQLLVTIKLPQHTSAPRPAPKSIEDHYIQNSWRSLFCCTGELVKRFAALGVMAQ